MHVRGRIWTLVTTTLAIFLTRRMTARVAAFPNKKRE